MKNFLLLGVLSLLLVGCGGAEPTTDTQPTPKPSVATTPQPTETRTTDTAADPTPTAAETNDPADTTPKTIVASFYPLAYFAEQVVGDGLMVVNLAGATDVHEYSPTPQDMVRLNEADLVLYLEEQFEPWVGDVIPNLVAAGVPTLEVIEGLELLKMEEHDEDDHDEHGHEGHEDEHEDEDDHHGHNHGEYDPHTWLDPVLAQAMIEKITAAVVQIDPANEANYVANAAAVTKRLVALDETYRAGLSACATDEVIVSHDAYGYIAERYDLDLHAIAGLSTQDTPSAKILAELKEEAEEGITHVLVEDNSVKEFAETLARETGLATLPLNPLGRGTLDTSKDYFDVMGDNLESFRMALSCE